MVGVLLVVAACVLLVCWVGCVVVMSCGLLMVVGVSGGVPDPPLNNCARNICADGGRVLGLLRLPLFQLLTLGVSAASHGDSGFFSGVTLILTGSAGAHNFGLLLQESSSSNLRLGATN